jgi:hypothetical protein
MSRCSASPDTILITVRTPKGENLDTWFPRSSATLAVATWNSADHVQWGQSKTAAGGMNGTVVGSSPTGGALKPRPKLLSNNNFARRGFFHALNSTHSRHTLALAWSLRRWRNKRPMSTIPLTPKHHRRRVSNGESFPRPRVGQLLRSLPLRRTLLQAIARHQQSKARPSSRRSRRRNLDAPWANAARRPF